MSDHELHVGVLLGFDELTSTSIREKFINVNQKEMLVELMDRVVELYREEPGMEQFRIPNSVHLIAEYDEKDMQEKIEDVIKVLYTKAVHLKVMLLKINLTVEDEEELSELNIEEM